MITAKEIIKRSPALLFVARGAQFHVRRIGSQKKWRSLLKGNDIKLELGSGAKSGLKGWTTVDIVNADITWDLRRGIPLPNDSVARIYSSHLLEHIPYHQLIPFLKECLRVLKPNGQFSVCVPNARLYIDAYIAGRSFRPRETWWEPGLIDTGSKIDQLNYIAYMRDEHKYMFDEENLVNTLLVAGFRSARLREYDEELDLPERDIESIYAVAEKYPSSPISVPVEG